MNETASARWGVTGAVAALVASWFGSLLVSAAFAPYLAAGGTSSPLWVRYGSFLSSQLVTLGCALGAIWLSKAPLASLGLSKPSGRGVQEALLIASGLVGLTALYGLLLQHLWPSAYQQMVNEQTFQRAWLAAPWPLLWFSAVAVAPVCEEVMFRGVLFAGLRRSWGLSTATVASGALFAAVHLMPLSLLPLLAIGVASALLFDRHRSLLVSFVLHAAYNALSLLLG